MKGPHQKTAVSVSILPLVFSPPIAHKHKEAIFLFSISGYLCCFRGFNNYFWFLGKVSVGL